MGSEATEVSLELSACSIHWNNGSDLLPELDDSFEPNFTRAFGEPFLRKHSISRSLGILLTYDSLCIDS